jgi:hypothetical protein
MLKKQPELSHTQLSVKGKGAKFYEVKLKGGFKHNLKTKMQNDTFNISLYFLTANSITVLEHAPALQK